MGIFQNPIPAEMANIRIAIPAATANTMMVKQDICKLTFRKVAVEGGLGVEFYCLLSD